MKLKYKKKNRKIREEENGHKKVNQNITFD
jgi:hypothetical protein